MKTWAEDHPKAGLMARKRAAILKAARETFLRLGYEGASMEAIAAVAGVSIMTLYRHTDSKDDLFAAVIANACDPDDEAEQAEFARLLKKPLRDVLIGLGLIAQDRLGDPQTIALLRTVIAETGRFPDLGRRAYDGLVRHLEAMVEAVLAQRPESAGLGRPRRAELAGAFIDDALGADVLRVLLGLGGLSRDHRHKRAEEASDNLLAALEAVH